MNFVTHGLEDGRIVRIDIGKTKVYNQTYKGIDFFVYKSIERGTWDAIEITTGLSIIGNRKLKKTCILHTRHYIDDNPSTKSDIAASKVSDANTPLVTITELKALQTRLTHDTTASIKEN